VADPARQEAMVCCLRLNVALAQCSGRVHAVTLQHVPCPAWCFHASRLRHRANFPGTPPPLHPQLYRPPLPPPHPAYSRTPLKLHVAAIIIATQPAASFGRVYAAYGGFFILLSYAWGWAVDHEVPDRMDWIGTAIALVGVMISFFWPR